MLVAGLILCVTVMVTAEEAAEVGTDGNFKGSIADDENHHHDEMDSNAAVEDEGTEDDIANSDVTGRFKRQAAGCRKGGKTYEWYCAEYKQNSIKCRRWEGCANNRCRTIRYSDRRKYEC